MYLQFETNNICNARCTFCPYPDMKKRAPMPDEMITKIISEMAPHIETCLPFLYQEPLLEKRLFSILYQVKEVNKNCQTAIYTNASKLFPDISHRIVQSELLDEMFISFYGPTKELYEKYQPGLNWYETQNNIRAFINTRQNKKKPHVTMWYIEIPELMAELNKMEEWKSIVDLFGVVQYESYCGLKPDLVFYPNKIRKPCYRLWQGMNILCDGTVVPCCIDYSGSVNLGDAFTENCFDIWTGEKMNALRQIHLDHNWGKLPDLCKKCVVWRRT